MYDYTKDTQATLKDQFHWHAPGYKSVFDENEGPIINKSQKYPTSLQSDKFIKLEMPEEEFAPPQRILIVSPSAHAIDLLLDKFDPISK